MTALRKRHWRCGRLAEGDDGFAAVIVVEGDLAAGHGADVGAGVGGDQGGLVGVGEAEEPVQAVHLFGPADGRGYATTLGWQALRC